MADGYYDDRGTWRKGKPPRKRPVPELELARKTAYENTPKPVSFSLDDAGDAERRRRKVDQLLEDLGLRPRRGW
jgi:hypothetical protein